MANPIQKLDNDPKLFVGQGDLVVFKAITDYANASLATFDEPKSLGQIVQDSTSWDGDEAETTQIKDEQGNLITAKVTAGTLAFSFEIASTSKTMIEKFLKGTSQDITAQTVKGFTGAVTARGFGVNLPVVTLPIAIFNDEKNRCFVYPKAKMVSSLSYSDGLWRIKVSATAEEVNNGNLYTGMILEGVANYSA